MPTNYNRANLITESSSLFPDNNTQEISPADLRQWIEDGTTSFVTQKDKSTLENSIYEAQASTLVAGATVNLALATGNYLHISGTGTINSFGTCPAGARFIIMFEDAATLTYNATSLIIPGGTNKTVVAGDCILILSEGSGNWRIVGYFVGAGIGAGTITGVTAGTGLSGGGTSGSVTLNLTNTGVSATSYTNADITVDAQGRITAASSGSPGGVTTVTASTPLASSGGTTPDITISKADATTDGYLDKTDWTTFNGKGNGTVTSITAGTGLNGGTITGSGTIDLANTSVTPAAYTNANITVDAQGRITAAANGTGGGVSSVATAGLISGGPITSTGTITTSMATGKLVGRASASTGVMEEITVGSGLTLTGGGTLNNTATPTPLGYYGAFSDYTNQTAAAINTGYPMKLGTTDLSNQVTVVSNSRVTIANTGIYNIQWSAQFVNSVSSVSDVNVWLRKNGVDVPGSSGRISVPVKHGSVDGHTIPSWNFLLDAVAGDYYEFVWSTDSTNTSIATLAAGSPQPSTASIVLTVTQQSGIMAGTGITGMVGTTGSTQTGATQTFSSSEMTITSAANTHTFAIPDASDVAKGLVNISAQTFSGIKTFGNGVSAGEIRFLEPSASGSNYVALKSQAMAADYSITLPPAAPSGAQYLQSTGVGGVLQWTSGTTTGVSSIGTINSATKNPNGVVISGSNIIMQTADATNVGLVSIGSQTFAGAKTFSDAATMSAAGSFTTPQLSISGATIRWINFGSGIFGSPTVSSRSAGTRIVILETLSATILDHAIGQGGNHMWFTTSSRSSGYEFYQQTAAASDRAFFIENSQTTVLNAFRYVNSTTSAQIRLDSASGQLTQNFISFGTGTSFGTSTAVASSYTTRSLGTRLIIQQTAQALNSDYAFGVEGTQDGTSNSGMWCSIQNTSQYWKWMAAGSTIAQLTGAAVLNLNAATGRLQINSTQVVGTRITGWGTPTTTVNRGALTNSSTTTDVLQVLGTLITDLRTHGLIGT